MVKSKIETGIAFDHMLDQNASRANGLENLVKEILKWMNITLSKIQQLLALGSFAKALEIS
jgi:hypothetical protein